VDHAAGCPCGPTLQRRHALQADAWATIFEEAGATVRREVYAPAFDTPSREAFLDLQVLGLPEFSGVYFDTTIRHPRNARYPDSHQQDGSCLLRAAGEKQATYPPTASARVVTRGAETWGRRCESSEHVLSLCAALANRNDLRRGRAGGAVGTAARLRRWRCMLDTALVFAVADQFLQARVPHRGARPHPRPSTDLGALEVCPRTAHPSTSPAG
jgi:hypothetical protein